MYQQYAINKLHNKIFKAIKANQSKGWDAKLKGLWATPKAASYRKTADF